MNNSVIEMTNTSLVDIIHQCAYLEGIDISPSEIESVLNNNPATLKTSTVLFVVGMQRAWRFLADNLGRNVDVAMLQ